jgi:predicted nucleotidyltransferase
MKLASFEALVRSLDRADVRFIVVGGIAVIAHGYGRTTGDIDLVIQLRQDVIAAAFTALETLGYHPRVPISAAQFADANLRSQWIHEKGMKVLNFHSDMHRETPIDLFISEPFDFEEEYKRAFVQEFAPGLPVRILRLESLLRMKAEAGRGQDLADIDELNLLHGGKSTYDR